MKKNIFLIFFLLNILNLFSQAPSKFNYQGVARDSKGNVLVNQSISLKVSLLDSVISGTNIYSELHSTNTNQLGLFNLSIGTGNVISGSFENVSWGRNDKFIKIEMDPNGGSNYVLIGTSQLLSVPYALNAKIAENVQLKSQEIYYTGGLVLSTESDVWLPSNVKLIVENDGNYLLNSTGRAWSDWSADISFRIRNKTKNIVIGQTIITAIDISSAHQGSGSLSRILQLSKGDELVMEFKATTKSKWQYGGDLIGGGSTINIVRISN